ncbi:hypothetical protein CANCADRAFT_94507 [Tortispora caseinolytica NRRL Y-17796]|uniref:Gamma-glutamyltransferase n=1 Tax=Tortispora caseinolytica NRRL Y-17796 TaxID=767744 RepID=A0A1E4TMA5_9ASCO|nr:hypothetical protein CANCADRAFT_94507 [Tortispora caseinolytica NRRL Y-17796]
MEAKQMHSSKSLEFRSRRSVVHSTKGIVCSSQTQASAAGVKILEKGGNCVDACVAAAAALTVLEPHMTGIGGDMFALFYDNSSKSVHGINGSGRSPAGLTYELAKSVSDTPRLKAESIHAVTVPGAFAGWVDSIEKWGSGLPLEDILAPAIDMAENGWLVGEITADLWKKGMASIQRWPSNGTSLFTENGQAPKMGEFFTNKELANTFRVLAKGGKQAFYDGPVGDKILEDLQKRGSSMVKQDLLNHKSVFVDPISLQYNDLKVWEIPPNGQGLVALQVLGMFKHTDCETAEHNSVEYLHAVIELLKLAFNDASRHIADPDHMTVSAEDLLSDAYLKSRASVFSKDHATHELLKDSMYDSDTVYLTATDKDGNACSFINSVYQLFGSGIVPEGLGFALHNRGANFSLSERSANAVGPSKRPYHTIIPAMVTKTNGDLYCTYGVMGAFMQPQGHVQVFLNMHKFGMSVQEALDAPRVCVSPSVDGSTEAIIQIEEGIPTDVIEGLKAKGHKIEIVCGTERALFGRGQIIKAEEGTRYSGGSDPRGDGSAIPQV